MKKTAIKTLRKRERVWEIDALRGFLMLGVLALHLYYTADAFLIDGYYAKIDSYKLIEVTDSFGIWFYIDTAGKIQRGAFPTFAGKYMQPPWVDVFFVISGISCIFSRDNLRSGLRLVGGAVFVSTFTKLLALYTGDPNQFIRFGVLHCYAACHLIYYFLLEDRSNKALLLTAVPSFIVGYFLKYHPISSEFALLYPFGIHEVNAAGRDYWPIFPMLGWFLVGVVFGRYWYSEKKSRFPNSIGKRLAKPLCFLGRKSGLIYCGHMVIYTLVFCGAGYIFDLY